MGEAKNKTAPKPVERPTAAIIQMRQAVQVGAGQELDADSLEFMRSLGALLNWMDELERLVWKQSGELPPPKLDA